jgi:hypothetical protein
MNNGFGFGGGTALGKKSSQPLNLSSDGLLE